MNIVIKLCLIFIIILTLSGCGFTCCNVSTDLPMTDQDRQQVDKMTDTILQLLKEKNYDELLKKDYLLSKQVHDNENVLNQMKKGLPCIDGYMGELQSYDRADRNFNIHTKMNKIKKVDYLMVKQPVKYSNRNMNLVLTFAKEEGKIKLFSISWKTNDAKNLDFLQCFNPFKK